MFAINVSIQCTAIYSPKPSLVTYEITFFQLLASLKWVSAWDLSALRISEQQSVRYVCAYALLDMSALAFIQKPCGVYIIDKDIYINTFIFSNWLKRIL